VESCLYEGVVRHRRRRPVAHGFSKRLFMVYLDLEELPRVFRGRWLWSTSRPAPLWFRRADHLGDPRRPLAECVRNEVEARTGRRPLGPVRLLTGLRTLGLAFNPVSFFYCFDAGGQHVEAVVAQVTNTPWGERHAYVLDARRARCGGSAIRLAIPKGFHVSPFMGMDQTYRFALRPPGRHLAVRIASEEAGEPVFDAALVLRRRAITGGSLLRALLRYPWMTAQVLAAIYWQAWRLRRKGAPVYPHPERVQPTPQEGIP
jgi:uncharacterized protein